jgi:hypothetical protein
MARVLGTLILDNKFEGHEGGLKLVAQFFGHRS